MKYLVITQSEAVIDAEDIRADLEAFGSGYADRWLDDLEKAGQQLAEFPNRFPQAPESHKSPRTIRQVLVGQYRVLFAVHGDTVRILRIRHASRRPFKPGELD